MSYYCLTTSSPLLFKSWDPEIKDPRDKCWHFRKMTFCLLNKPLLSKLFLRVQKMFQSYYQGKSIVIILQLFAGVKLSFICRESTKNYIYYHDSILYEIWILFIEVLWICFLKFLHYFQGMVTEIKKEKSLLLTMIF